MKILLISDEESPSLWDYYQPEKLSGVDLILSCGDLKREYLEFLVTMTNRPLFYVHGNHDLGFIDAPPEGCECLDDRVVDVNGLRIIGLGGCMRYHPGPLQYTEAEMARRIRRLRRSLRRTQGVDVVIAHAPPKGLGDADDPAHRGFACFRDLIDKYKPRFFIHGHVHPRYGHRLPRSFSYGETTVFNAVGWHILEIEPKSRPTKKSWLTTMFGNKALRES